MKTYISWGIMGVVVAIICGALWWVVENRLENSPPDERLVTVATTIFPLADIAEQVGGDRVRVLQILPPGVSEHDYTLTPRQVAELQDAKALFAIGHGLDDWVMQGVEAEKVVVVDRGIELREFGGEEGEDEHGHEEPGAIDPHYWLTVPNAALIAETMATTLQTLDPEGSSVYEANLEKYVGELADLEEELQRVARGAKKKQFMTVHDAWSYWADQYGLELIATYEPVEGQEPSISEIRALQETVGEHGVTAFFTEPQKQSTGAIRFLRDDLGLEIRVLDPIGGLVETGSYVEMMRRNMSTLSR